MEEEAQCGPCATLAFACRLLSYARHLSIAFTRRTPRRRRHLNRRQYSRRSAKMADADEDVIPRSGPMAEEVDLCEETQDFRFLAAVGFVLE